MLSGIIVSDTIKYKIYLENNKIWVKKLTNEGVKYLNKDEINKLINDVLSSKKTFIKNENGYDIFLDEECNKRFLKNGIEDFKLFFLNNGVNAIMYDGDKKDKDTTIKQILLRDGQIFICSMLMFLAIASSENSYFLNVKYIVNEPIARIAIQDKLTAQDIIDAIMNTNGKNITEEQKRFLANEDFINLVIENADYSRYYDLKDKTHNIDIHHFSDDINDNRPHIDGYYNTLMENLIYLYDNAAKETLPHEFVHFMQQINEYRYVQETCAELMNHEFYDSDVRAYYNQVRRICILMEIIGPKPVLDCNFRGYTGDFEKSIYDILGKEEGKELLSLLKNSPFDQKETIKEVDAQIDKYLAKMYEIVYSSDINDNMLIKKLKEGDLNEVLARRVYFNKKNINYYTCYYSLDEKPDGKVDCYYYDLDYSEIDKIFVYKRDIYTEEEYKALDSYEKDHVRLIPLSSEDGNKLFGSDTVLVELDSLDDLEESLQSKDPGTSSPMILFKDGILSTVRGDGSLSKAVYNNSYSSIYSLFDKEEKVKKL